MEMPSCKSEFGWKDGTCPCQIRTMKSRSASTSIQPNSLKRYCQIEFSVTPRFFSRLNDLLGLPKTHSRIHSVAIYSTSLPLRCSPISIRLRSGAHRFVCVCRTSTSGNIRTHSPSMQSLLRLCSTSSTIFVASSFFLFSFFFFFK